MDMLGWYARGVGRVWTDVARGSTGGWERLYICIPVRLVLIVPGGHGSYGSVKSRPNPPCPLLPLLSGLGRAFSAPRFILPFWPYLADRPSGTEFSSPGRLVGLDLRMAPVLGHCVARLTSLQTLSGTWRTDW